MHKVCVRIFTFLPRIQVDLHSLGESKKNQLFVYLSWSEYLHLFDFGGMVDVWLKMLHRLKRPVKPSVKPSARPSVNNFVGFIGHIKS